MEIAIIGAAGNVGAEIAFLIAQNELADKLILLDILKDKLKGTALDIEYSSAHKRTKIVVGEYKGICSSDIIVITAGKPRTTEASRDELFEANSKVLESILKEIKNEKALFVIVTNPVDPLVSKAVELGLSENKVVGVSTLHDTLRLRAILKRKGISDSDSHVRGKHGEGEYILNEHLDSEEIKKEVSEAGKQIINLRGFTSFGIAAATSEIIDSIINNKETIASIHNYGSVPVKFQDFRVTKAS